MERAESIIECEFLNERIFDDLFEGMDDSEKKCAELIRLGMHLAEYSICTDYRILYKEVPARHDEEDAFMFAYDDTKRALSVCKLST